MSPALVCLSGNSCIDQAGQCENIGAVGLFELMQDCNIVGRPARLLVNDSVDEYAKLRAPLANFPDQLCASGMSL